MFAEPYQLHSIPSIGGPMLSQGPQIQSRRHLAPKQSFDPQIEIWNTRNQWSWGALWKKGTYTLEAL